MAKATHGIGASLKIVQVKRTKSRRTRPNGYQPRKGTGR